LETNDAFDALLKNLNQPQSDQEDDKKKRKREKKEKKRKREEEEVEKPVVIRNAHRAKFRKNKAVSTYDAGQLSEIFGVKTKTVVTETTVEVTHEKQVLKETGVSIQDYFAAKMKSLDLVSTKKEERKKKSKK
jgi:hypothetical protein